MKEKIQGKGPRGRGRASTVKGNEKKDECTSIEGNKGENGSERGKGLKRGSGKYVITCYKCGEDGHKACERLEKPNLGKRGEARTQFTIAY